MSEGHIRFEMARSGLEENCVRSTECAQCHIQVWLVSHTQFTTNSCNAGERKEGVAVLTPV